MKDWKFYSRCFMCKANRFFVRKRQIHLKHLNKAVTSREHICTPCFKGVLDAQERGILN